MLGQGLTGPFSAFRDDGAHVPLDYAELEQILLAHPEWDPLVAEHLNSLIELSPDEVPAAQAALNSPIEAIREHARRALKRFEKRTGQQVLPVRQR
ncbi:MAG: hypothetical protein Q4D79_15995 [Propionibacteriaceae bacterium]|nr:hypothetical protein [Propionibacteriaceae bacterium]